MKIDVWSCSEHTYEDAIKRSRFHYQDKGVQYVGPVVKGELHLSIEGRHVILSVADPTTNREGDGNIPNSRVYGLLILDGEQVPCPQDKLGSRHW